MHLRTDTYQQQSDLAKYCRTNIQTKSLKVRHDRIHHYRRLIYNVIEDSLKAAYPLLNDLLFDDQWNKLVNDFFATHSCQSTQVWKMPSEFYDFVKSNDLQLKTIYPHLVDLAYFEWVEVEMFMMEDMDYPLFKTDGDWVNDKIAVNPEFRLLQLNYPVHIKKSRSITLADKGQYFLLVFREKKTGKVQFMDISALHALIIENIIKGLTLNEIVIELKGILKFDNIDLMQEQLIPFFNTLKKKGFFPGFIV